MKTLKRIGFIAALVIIAISLSACQPGNSTSSSSSVESMTEQDLAEAVATMEAQYESSDAANDSRDEAASVVGTWYYKDKDVTYAFAADGKYVAFVGGKEYLSGSYDVWGGEIDLRFRSSSGSLEHLLLRYKFQDGALFLGEGSASYPFVRQ